MGKKVGDKLSRAEMKGLLAAYKELQEAQAALDAMVKELGLDLRKHAFRSDGTVVPKEDASAGS